MLRSTLVAEGSSDRALIPILRWLLVAHWDGAFADPQFLGSSAVPLSSRVSDAVRDYPCDLLVIHRDSDNSQRNHRIEEIREALVGAGLMKLPTVCVIPVRSTEAWLLADAGAIRRAAGNPKGKRTLSLPRIKDIEMDVAPKDRLNDALRAAAELTGRRLKKFHLPTAVLRVVEQMEDFEALRELSAFRAFETDLAEKLQELKPVGN